MRALTPTQSSGLDSSPPIRGARCRRQATEWGFARIAAPECVLPYASAMRA